MKANTIPGVETTGYCRVVPARLQRSRVTGWLIEIILLPVAFGMLAVRARAQDDTNEIPQIRPPHAELPPTIWEQHGGGISLVVVLVLVLLGLAVWLWTRPRPAVVIPPEVQAREALAALPVAASEGERLSQISRILRHYIQQAFELPRAELNTTEFCRLVADHAGIGPELAGALAAFLQDSDRRKFSAESTEPAAVNAVTQALALIEQGEARRERLRALAAANEQPPA
jgi:hypothetical protein